MASFSSDDSLDNLISRPDFDALLQNNATDNLTTENVTFDLGLDLENDAEPIAKNVVQTAQLPITVEAEQNKENTSRFANLVSDDLDDIANMCSEKSTHYQTRWAVKLFRGK